MAFHNSPKQEDLIVWRILQDWLSQDEEGQAILDSLRAGHLFEGSLLHWLQKRSAQAPPQISTYISGGQVKNLINVAHLGVLHVHQTSTETPLNRQEYRNWRDELIAQVEDDVERVLEQSLCNAEQSLPKAEVINLQKEKQSHQVNHPSNVEVKGGSQPNELLSPQTKIIEVFDQKATAGMLLILGAPGAGKTMTVLELAQQLINRANNNSAPIPIWLNLSSWKDDKTIADWLVAKVSNGIPKLPKHIVQRWLSERQLLPLLDGLDELESTRQEKCIQEINKFLKSEYRPRHLVVCCRLKEYQLLQTKLDLKEAICLQSLSEKQIEHYLKKISFPEEIWHNIQAQPELLDLVKTPLFLRILTLAYPTIVFQEWQRLKSSKECLHYLFNAYIKHMLKREIKKLWYQKAKEPRQEQTLKWLSWLAKKQEATSFLIENMQANLLQISIQKWGYNIGVSIIIWQIYGIVFVLSLLLPILWLAGIRVYTDFGLFTKIFRLLFCFLLIFTLTGVSLPGARLLINGLSKLGVLCFSLITGSSPIVLLLINGLRKVGELTLAQTEEIKLVDSLVGIDVSFKIDRISTVSVNFSKRTGTNVKISFFTIIWCLGTGIFLEKVMGMRDGIVCGLFFWMFMEFTIRWEIWLYRLLSNRSDQELIIRWKQVIDRLIVGLMGGIFLEKKNGLVLGFLSGIIFGTLNGKFGKRQEPDLITFWLTSPFSTTVIVRLKNTSDEEIRVTPNQGIWRSALNARKYAVISGLIVGLITGLYFCRLSGGLITGLLLGGLNGGLIGGLFFGGRACIQHFTLRVILCLSGSIPRNYAQFLNYTTERMFLQRVGGHYRFIHELLQKHFAELTPAQIKELSRIDAYRDCKN